MSIALLIFNWIFCVLCFISISVFGVSVPSVLMAVLGVTALPLEFIREKWEVIPFDVVTRPFVIGIIFVLLTVVIPIPEEEVPAAVDVVMENREGEFIDEIPLYQKEVGGTGGGSVVAAVMPDNLLLQIPPFSGTPYVEINQNVPFFTKEELTSVSFETYSPLDAMGRCGVVTACIGKDIMPTEERGKIGNVKPTGWHTVKYNGLVDGNYLYNRCHLIGYQLTGENDNVQNLITGTRYMNVDGMLPFENMVDDYVDATGNHVMYRVTPLFDGDNLLASGVLMEAFSVEDEGRGVSFNVFCYNVQPGVDIVYASGESCLSGQQTLEKAGDGSTQPVGQVKEPVREEIPVSPANEPEGWGCFGSCQFWHEVCSKCKKWKNTYLWPVPCYGSRRQCNERAGTFWNL